MLTKPYSSNQTCKKTCCIGPKPVKAGEVIHDGAIAFLTADGHVVNAGHADAVAGPFRAGVSGTTGGGTADNTAGEDGDCSVKLCKGIFSYEHDGVTPADIGTPAAIVDNNTVAPGGADPNVTIWDVTADGCVEVRFH